MHDMKVTEGGTAEVEDFVGMLHDYDSWLVLHRHPHLYETLEWEDPPLIVEQVLGHTRSGRTRICRDLLSRVTGGSVLTEEAPEFAPAVKDPELYLHFLVTRMWRRQLSMAALVADARAEATRRGARLLRTHCWAGEDRRLVREYEELGFTATLEFEVRRSDGSIWPGQMLQTRV
ncbi:GNAT family N-acetyltransferase [Streptomyces sp. NPDC006512]|uniref:GNAT family N-acetyltransferase n=1 Tax=Streptomyces sp. NPDC006512 TaxID=3154307 RepID=UPI0033A68C1D